MTTLLTTREAAAALRVSEETLRRYAKQGLVRRIALNRRAHRYDAASIEALISANEVTTANGDLVELGDGAADHESA